MILYHLDRNNILQPGTPITPVDTNAIPEDLKKTLFFSQFEHGISWHGLRYLSLICKEYQYYFRWNKEVFYRQDTVCEQLDMASNQIIELNVELVRRAYFPQYPSRYESLFAVRSIQDFYQWPELCSSEEIPNANILAIDAPDEVNCFDSMWLRGGLFHGASNAGYHIAYASAHCFDYAYKYWSKIPSDSPRWEYILPVPIDGTRIHRAVVR